MKVTLKEKQVELHYSFRMMMMYEQIQGKSLDFQNITLQDLVILFYTAVVSTLQYNKLGIGMQYEDFLNWLDDNGGEQLLVDFSNWYVEQVQLQNNMVPETDKKKKKSKSVIEPKKA